LAERYPWILTDIESWYGKYLDVYVTVTDISGNENKFKGPRIWFGKVRKTEDLQAEYLEKKSSANKPVLAEKVEKIPQRKKNPFFRPEDPYDMVLKENLDKQINRPTEPKVIEDFDLRKDLEKNWGIISTPPTVENPFPAEEKAQKSGSPELRQRLLKKQHKSAKKKLSPPSLRDYLDGLMK